MPYKNVFDDSINPDKFTGAMKNVFDDTYESTFKEPGIEFKFGGAVRAPTDIDLLFNAEAIKNLQERHPNLYGMLGAGIETSRMVGDWTVDMIPALKYARPDDREMFASLSTIDQRIAILQETAGALLWAVAFRPGEAFKLPIAGARSVYGAGKMTAEALAKGIKAAPKVAAKGAVKGTLWAGKSTVKGAFRGGIWAGRKITEPILDRAFRGWKPINTRKAFMDWAKKKGIPKPRAEQAYAFGSGETTAVRPGSKQIWEVFELEQEVARLQVKGFGATVSSQSAKMRDSFKGWAGKRFSRKDKNMNLDTASEEVVEEFGRWYAAAEPSIHKTARTAAQMNDQIGKDLYGFVNLYPIRFVLGAGEKLWQTFTKVYRPIETATKFKNRAIADNIMRLYAILEESGLGTITKQGRFKPIAQFNQNVKQQAYKFVTEADNIYEAVRKGAMTEAAGAKAIQGIINTTAPEFPIVRRLVDASYEYFDHLYAQHTSWKMREIFDRAGVTAAGADRLDLVFKNEILPAIEDLFASSNGRSSTEKVLGTQNLLKRLQVEAEMKGMFASEGFGGDVIKQTISDLQYGAEGGVMEYLEGYAARMIKRDYQAQDISFKLMAAVKDPFYTQARTATQAIGRAADFDSMIYLRTSSQAKEIFYNKTLARVSHHVGGLPQDYKTYISHWIARLHGIPSQLDHQLARVLNNTIPGTWDARRVFNLTKTVNDFTYMGILGLKPFSAMRNLFQPAITLTPTLGKGFMKGWEHMLKGYGQLRNKEMIGYLQSIGVITDYAPELMKMTNVFKIPKAVSVGGTTFALPTRDAVRDFTMWMFSQSDRLNRYVSGAAGAIQWEEGIAAAKALRQELVKKGLKLDVGTELRTLMRETGADKRPAWIQSEIRDLLRRGHVDKAKKSFVTDVVAGSQWLYGPLDAPIITQTFGSLGRQMAVFQSWWVHYGANLEQWARTGRGPGGSAERMLSWAMSSAVVATAMSGVWGTGTAGRSTFLGPFAGAAGRAGDPYMAALMVPAWRPVIQSAELAIKAGQLIGGASPSEIRGVTNQAKALLKTSFNFLPGGSVGYQAYNKLFMKSQPGRITGYEMKAAIKEVAGIRSY